QQHFPAPLGKALSGLLSRHGQVLAFPCVQPDGQQGSLLDRFWQSRASRFLCHRVRFAMSDGPEQFGKKLCGEIEADETYVGGQPRNSNRSSRTKKQWEKTPVIGI